MVSLALSRCPSEPLGKCLMFFFGANANTVDAIIVLRSIEVANDVDVTVGMSGLVDVRVKHS